MLKGHNFQVGDKVTTVNPYFNKYPCAFKDIYIIEHILESTKKAYLTLKDNPKIWMYEDIMYLKSL
jgi:hypothetical protein